MYNIKQLIITPKNEIKVTIRYVISRISKKIIFEKTFIYIIDKKELLDKNNHYFK